MNNPVVLASLLVLALVILAGNTLIAVAFLRGRKSKQSTARKGEDQAVDELHARVQELTRKSK